MVATIQCHAAVPLRHHKLKDGLLGWPDAGLAIQEAILEEQLLLGFNIGSCSLFVKHHQEGFLKGLTWSPKVLHHLVEDRVLLLFYLPIRNIGSGQSRWFGGYCLPLAGVLASWIGVDSQFSPLLKRGDGIVQDSFDPRIWNFV